MSKRGLGRGLGALIPGAGEVEGGGATELPVSQIFPNPEQPRMTIDEEGLEELTASVANVGVLQPILVRPHEEKYQIIAGERRWRAAKAAGLDAVPVRIVASSAEESLEIALIENLQRQDLNALEEAMGYRKLLGEYQMTQAELAERVSKSRSAITNALRLLDLPEQVQALVVDGSLSAGHARAVLAVPDEAKRIALADKIAKEGLSVREAENLARLYAASEVERPARPTTPKSYKVVARKLRKLLETNVRVRLTPKKSKIEIDFNGEEDLERIFRMLVEGSEGGGA